MAQSMLFKYKWQSFADKPLDEYKQALNARKLELESADVLGDPELVSEWSLLLSELDALGSTSKQLLISSVSVKDSLSSSLPNQEEIAFAADSIIDEITSLTNASTEVKTPIDDISDFTNDKENISTTLSLSEDSKHECGRIEDQQVDQAHTAKPFESINGHDAVPEEQTVGSSSYSNPLNEVESEAGRSQSDTECIIEYKESDNAMQAHSGDTYLESLNPHHRNTATPPLDGGKDDDSFAYEFADPAKINVGLICGNVSHSQVDSHCQWQTDADTDMHVEGKSVETNDTTEIEQGEEVEIVYDNDSTNAMQEVTSTISTSIDATHHLATSSSRHLSDDAKLESVANIVDKTTSPAEQLPVYSMTEKGINSDNDVVDSEIAEGPNLGTKSLAKLTPTSDLDCNSSILQPKVEDGDVEKHQQVSKLENSSIDLEQTSSTLIQTKTNGGEEKVHISVSLPDTDDEAGKSYNLLSPVKEGSDIQTTRKSWVKANSPPIMSPTGVDNADRAVSDTGSERKTWAKSPAMPLFRNVSVELDVHADVSDEDEDAIETDGNIALSDPNQSSPSQASLLDMFVSEAALSQNIERTEAEERRLKQEKDLLKLTTVIDGETEQNSQLSLEEERKLEEAALRKAELEARQKAIQAQRELEHEELLMQLQNKQDHAEELRLQAEQERNLRLAELARSREEAKAKREAQTRARQAELKAKQEAMEAAQNAAKKDQKAKADLEKALRKERKQRELAQRAEQDKRRRQEHEQAQAALREELDKAQRDAAERNARAAKLKAEEEAVDRAAKEARMAAADAKRKAEEEVRRAALEAKKEAIAEAERRAQAEAKRKVEEAAAIRAEKAKAAELRREAEEAARKKAAEEKLKKIKKIQEKAAKDAAEYIASTKKAAKVKASKKVELIRSNIVRDVEGDLNRKSVVLKKEADLKIKNAEKKISAESKRTLEDRKREIQQQSRIDVARAIGAAKKEGGSEVGLLIETIRSEADRECQQKIEEATIWANKEKEKKLNAVRKKHLKVIEKELAAEKQAGESRIQKKVKEAELRATEDTRRAENDAKQKAQEALKSKSPSKLLGDYKEVPDADVQQMIDSPGGSRYMQGTMASARRVIATSSGKTSKSPPVEKPKFVVGKPSSESGTLQHVINFSSDVRFSTRPNLSPAQMEKRREQIARRLSRPVDAERLHNFAQRNADDTLVVSGADPTTFTFTDTSANVIEETLEFEALERSFADVDEEQTSENSLKAQSSEQILVLEDSSEDIIVHQKKHLDMQDEFNPKTIELGNIQKSDSSSASLPDRISEKVGRNAVSILNEKQHHDDILRGLEKQSVITRAIAQGVSIAIAMAHKDKEELAEAEVVFSKELTEAQPDSSSSEARKTTLSLANGMYTLNAPDNVTGIENGNTAVSQTVKVVENQESVGEPQENEVPLQNTSPLESQVSIQPAFSDTPKLSDSEGLDRSNIKDIMSNFSVAEDDLPARVSDAINELKITEGTMKQSHKAVISYEEMAAKSKEVEALDKVAAMHAMLVKARKERDVAKFELESETNERVDIASAASEHIALEQRAREAIENAAKQQVEAMERELAVAKEQVNKHVQLNKSKQDSKVREAKLIAQQAAKEVEEIEIAAAQMVQETTIEKEAAEKACEEERIQKLKFAREAQQQLKKMKAEVRAAQEAKADAERELAVQAAIRKQEQLARSAAIEKSDVAARLAELRLQHKQQADLEAKEQYTQQLDAEVATIQDDSMYQRDDSVYKDTGSEVSSRTHVISGQNNRLDTASVVSSTTHVISEQVKLFPGTDPAIAHLGIELRYAVVRRSQSGHIGLNLSYVDALLPSGAVVTEASGPVANAGIKKGDTIVEINGQSMMDASFGRVVTQISNCSDVMVFLVADAESVSSVLEAYMQEKQLEVRPDVKSEMRSKARPEAILDVKTGSAPDSKFRSEAMTSSPWAPKQQGVEPIGGMIGVVGNSHFEVESASEDETSPFRVLARFRPLMGNESSSPNLHIMGRDGKILMISGKSGKQQEFQFDYILSENSQQHEVFEAVLPSVDSVLNGDSASILAYGQSKSGRTFTVRGGLCDLQGVLPRVLERLLVRSQAMSMASDLIYKISASCIGLHHDIVRDYIGKKKKKFDFFHDSTYGFTRVREAKTIEITDSKSLNQFLDCACSVTAHSRVHLVFRIFVQAIDILTEKTKFEAVLNIAELAAAEKILEDKDDPTVPMSQRAKLKLALNASNKEIQLVNKSLSALGAVLSSIQAEKAHVSYRGSKLTYLLQGALGGKGRSVIVATLSPSTNSTAETTNSCKFVTAVSSTNWSNRQQIIENKKNGSRVTDVRMSNARASNNAGTHLVVTASSRVPSDLFSVGNFDGTLSRPHTSPKIDTSENPTSPVYGSRTNSYGLGSGRPRSGSFAKQSSSNATYIPQPRSRSGSFSET